MKNYLIIYCFNNYFYNCYEVDAYIINMFLGYKIIDNKKIGFPKSCLTKVTDLLEDKHVSYKIIYNIEKEEYRDFGKINNYNKYYNMVYEKITINEKINLLIRKIEKAKREELDDIIRLIDGYFREKEDY